MFRRAIIVQRKLEGCRVLVKVSSRKVVAGHSFIFFQSSDLCEGSSYTHLNCTGSLTALCEQPCIDPLTTEQKTETES